MTAPRTITGKVFRGALYFDSATAFMQALVPFEGKRVEVTVREMPEAHSPEPVREPSRPDTKHYCTDEIGLCSYGREQVEQAEKERDEQIRAAGILGDLLTHWTGRCASLEAELAIDRAVCLCPCPPEAHESYGEDGESCADETHECLRVAVAVRDYVSRLEAETARVGEEGKELREALWLGHGHLGILYGDDGEMQCGAPHGPGIRGPVDFKRDEPVRVRDAFLEAIRAAFAQARRDAFEEAAKIAEGGHFLHEDAPDARFGKSCAAAIRRAAKGEAK